MRESEVAEPTLDGTIIEMAFLAAKEYPYLRILCPWCRKSIMGSEFQAHGMEHQREIT